MDKLQTPPIRTPLAEGDGQPAGRSAATAKTAKEWWLYWQRATELANDHTDSIAELDTAINDLSDELNGTIRAGTHAARLAAAPDPLDALWVETDRNNVVYQVHLVAGAPAWVYVTGIMWGTLVPDQRPAGLGVNDTGFLFGTTDSLELYRWSGAAWVNQTAAPTLGNVIVFASATASLTLTTTFQNITGATVTLPRAGRYLIHAVFDCVGNLAGDSGATILGQLVVNGVAQPALATFRAEFAGAARGTITQQWVYQAAGAGEIALLQANKSGGTGGSLVAASHSGISALWVSP